MEDVEILQALQAIDDWEEECKTNPIVTKPPSTFSLQMMGASDNIALNFLYSTGLDHMVDKFMDLIIQGGSIEEILSSDEMFASMMRKMGFNTETMFKGQVSQTLIRAIDKTMESRSYARTKSKLFKVIKIFKAMDKGAKTIKDPDMRTKYEEAARAVKQVIKFVGKIYQNRKLVNERVQKGIALIFNESAEELPVLVLESFEIEKNR